MKNKIKSKLASNCDRCDNVLGCCQLENGNCATVEVRMRVKSTQVSISEC